MTRWLCAVVIGGALTGFALLLLAGHYPESGPVLVQLSWNHGIHLGDLFVVAGWAVSMLALVVLVHPRGRAVLGRLDDRLERARVE